MTRLRGLRRPDGLLKLAKERISPVRIYESTMFLRRSPLALFKLQPTLCPHVGCFAHGRRNDPRVKRPVLAGDVCVDNRAGVDAYLALTEPPGPARPPARKYWPSEDEVVPSSQIAAIGCLWCALMMVARAVT